MRAFSGQAALRLAAEDLGRRPHQFVVLSSRVQSRNHAQDGLLQSRGEFRHGALPIGQFELVAAHEVVDLQPAALQEVAEELGVFAQSFGQ